MHSLMSELHPHDTGYSGDDSAVDGAGDAEHPDAGVMRRVTWSVDAAGDDVDGYECQCSRSLLQGMSLLALTCTVIIQS